MGATDGDARPGALTTAAAIDNRSVVIGHRVGWAEVISQVPGTFLLWLWIVSGDRRPILLAVLGAVVVLGLAVAARSRVEVHPNGVTVVGFGRRVWAWDDLEQISPWMHDHPQVKIYPRAGRAVSFRIWQRSRRTVLTEALVARATAAGVHVGIPLEEPIGSPAWFRRLRASR